MLRNSRSAGEHHGHHPLKLKVDSERWWWWWWWWAKFCSWQRAEAVVNSPGASRGKRGLAFSVCNQMTSFSAGC